MAILRIRNRNFRNCKNRNRKNQIAKIGIVKIGIVILGISKIYKSCFSMHSFTSGYKFRPASNNPYFAVPKDDEEIEQILVSGAAIHQQELTLL